MIIIIRLVKRRIDRCRASVRVYLYFANRLRCLRAAIAFRKGARMASIAANTFVRSLATVRKRISERLNAVKKIQQFYIHTNRKKQLTRVIGQKVMDKRKLRLTRPNASISIDQRTVKNINIY